MADAQEAVRAIEGRIRQEVRDPAAAERTAIMNLADELNRHQIELPATPDPTGSIGELSVWANAVLDAAARDLTHLRELSRSETEAATVKTETGRTTVAALGFENSRQLQQALIETTAEQIAATREHARATSQIEPTKQLDALLTKARGLRDSLSELARQLADAKFVGSSSNAASVRSSPPLAGSSRR